jgi:hypothetical protein
MNESTIEIGFGFWGKFSLTYPRIISQLQATDSFDLGGIYFTQNNLEIELISLNLVNGIFFINFLTLIFLNFTIIKVIYMAIICSPNY